MRGKNWTNPDCGTFYKTTSLDSKHVNVMKKKRKENYFRLKKMKMSIVFTLLIEITVYLTSDLASNVYCSKN